MGGWREDVDVSIVSCITGYDVTEVDKDEVREG